MDIQNRTSAWCDGRRRHRTVKRNKGSGRARTYRGLGSLQQEGDEVSSVRARVLGHFGSRHEVLVFAFGLLLIPLECRFNLIKSRYLSLKLRVDTHYESTESPFRGVPVAVAEGYNPAN